MKKGLEFAVSFAGVLTMSSSLVLLPPISGNDALQARPDQASVTGTATSFSGGANLTTVTGTVTLPRGLFFNGNVVITPTYNATTNKVTSLALNVPTIEAVSATSTFSRAAAEVLTQIRLGNTSVISNVEAFSAIIRAGAGADGLD